MNIKEIKEMLQSGEWTSTSRNTERANVLQSLLTKLTPTSKSEIQSFQRSWDPKNNTFDDFKKAQDKIFLYCLDLEQSELGRDVREVCNLEPLLDTTVV